MSDCGGGGLCTENGSMCDGCMDREHGNQEVTETVEQVAERLHRDGCYVDCTVPVSEAWRMLASRVVRGEATYEQALASLRWVQE